MSLLWSTSPLKWAPKPTASLNWRYPNSSKFLREIWGRSLCPRWRISRRRWEKSTTIWSCRQVSRKALMIQWTEDHLRSCLSLTRVSMRFKSWSFAKKRLQRSIQSAWFSTTWTWRMKSMRSKEPKTFWKMKLCLRETMFSRYSTHFTSCRESVSDPPKYLKWTTMRLISRSSRCNPKEYRSQLREWPSSWPETLKSTQKQMLKLLQRNCL